MSNMSIEKMSWYGVYAGLGVALIPATATLIIATSRTLLVNIIANAILRVLTVGSVGINIYGFLLIKVPFLWKVSLFSAVIGGSLAAISLIAAMAHKIYTRSFAG